MTHNEFIKKMNEMFDTYLPHANKVKTVNELIFVLRHDDEVEDYCININSETEGFSFGLLKDTFYPTRLLSLNILSLEYEEEEESPYPLLILTTN